MISSPRVFTIRVRKKVSKTAIISSVLAVPAYCWIAHRSGVPLGLVVIVGAFSYLALAGAFFVGAWITKRYGGWPDNQDSGQNSN